MMRGHVSAWTVAMLCVKELDMADEDYVKLEEENRALVRVVAQLSSWSTCAVLANISNNIYLSVFIAKHYANVVIVVLIVVI